MAIKDDMENVQETVINELITENGITNTLNDNQVTEDKILNGAVTAAKLGSDVDLGQVNDLAVTPAKLSQAYLPLTGGSVTGNVGIGTTTSSVPLTVEANSSGSNIRLNGRSSDGYAFLHYRNNADNTTNAEIGVSDAKNMQFYTNGSERMRIQADGTIKLSNVPTSASGLSTGTIYSDGGTLKIV